MFLYFYIFLIILLQVIIMKIYDISEFNIYSLVKNIGFTIIIYMIFCKQKGFYKKFFKTFYKKHIILLIIPLLYLFHYICYPTYVGQDLYVFPLTMLGHLSNNLQKIQNQYIGNKLLTETYIDLDDTKWNFWYEYMHFFVDDIQYCFVINRPGKFDDYILVSLHILNINTGESQKFHDTINKKYYTSYTTNDECVSEIIFNNFKYKTIIELKNRKIHSDITYNNIDIQIDGYITARDNYCAISILNQYIPYLNKFIKMGGISDIYPYEYLNDQSFISDSEIKVNDRVSTNCVFWYDRYIGTDYHNMTNYIWFMNYSENWNIFILYYTDYPYTNKNGLIVSFFYNKKLDKMIECSNVYNHNTLTKMFVGVSSDVELLDNSKLTDQTMKYKVKYNSPRIKCNIQSKKMYKLLDKYNFYERVSKDKDYGEIEELQSVVEQLRYDEFGGKSNVVIEYDGIVYNEECLTTIDGISWKNGNGPQGYKERKPFFDKTFYVRHPNRDILNGKLN